MHCGTGTFGPDRAGAAAGTVDGDDDTKGRDIMTRVGKDALKTAAEAALRAPSILDTQSWRWHVTNDALDLYADPDRQLPVIDPDHRLSAISCGIALHHARIALATEGYGSETERFPDPSRPDLLARITLSDHHPPSTDDIPCYEATPIRHTGRRLVADAPVPPDALDRLREVAAAEQAHLYILRADDTPVLASAAAPAQAVEIADPQYRAELAQWTHRDPDRGDRVPAATATPPGARTVPVREFTPDSTGQLAAGEGTDRQATFAVLAGDHDTPRGWLQAGEALSAVLLTAVSDGLSVSPMSDVVEVAGTRETLRSLLSGLGYPFLVLRIGVAQPTTCVPPTPRRDPTDAMDLD
jgi:nitroreductase